MYYIFISKRKKETDSVCLIIQDVYNYTCQQIKLTTIFILIHFYHSKICRCKSISQNLHLTHAFLGVMTKSLQL